MKLFAHQQEAFDLATKGNIALFHDCGSGKTCTGLNIIRHWKQQGDGPALVVCPISVIQDAWMADCKKFTPDLSIISLWDNNPRRRIQKLNQSGDIYVANYETVKSLHEDIRAKGFKVLIVDESSKAKCPTSQITRALLALAGVPSRAKNGKGFNVADPIPHRYVLSGTPAPNDESEYWAQIKIVTGFNNDVFSSNFYSFRCRYFYSIPIGRTGQKKWAFRKDTHDEFNTELAKVTHVVRKEDALDLPKQTHEVRRVTLGPAECKAYNALKEDLVLRFSDETILATHALVEIMKLRQITSGFVYGETGTHQVGKSKLNELKDLLEEIGDKQVIIWCNFKEEMNAVYETLKDSRGLPMASVLTGDNRQEVIDAFKSGWSKYLIANPQSAGHGLTFVNCSYAIYFGLNYSYELLKQSQDRIHRIGQKVPCTYYYLLADRSIDEVIYKSLLHKSEMSTEVLNYLKEHSHGRRPQIQTT